MLNKKIGLLCGLMMIVLIFQLNQRTMTTLKYFPIDEEAQFTEVATRLSLGDPYKKEGLLLWELESSHPAHAYLDHDVGLLYRNGQLTGIQSKWSQEDNQMKQSIELEPQSNSFYQAISYHYLELHPSANQMRSNHQMSATQLFIVEQSESVCHSFNLPRTRQEQTWSQQLDQTTSAYLDKKWAELIDAFHLDRKLYVEISLIDLPLYQNEPLPGLTLTETKRVIAQLWEGFYQNYIIPNSKKQPYQGSVMPLILFAKQRDHLVVLFTDSDNNEQQLIQKINTN